MAPERIEYTEPLTGTLAEAAQADPLGIPYSPLARTWQANPGRKQILPSGVRGMWQKQKRNKKRLEGKRQPDMIGCFFLSK